MIALSIINTIIFLSLALLHIYWATGGTKFINSVLPEIESNKKLFYPNKLITLAVAAVLLFFALISLSASSLFGLSIKKIYTIYGNAFISLVFMARAIGDLKYVGYFKTIKQTVFAKNDSKYFSPLCSFVAILALIITYKLYSVN